MATSLPVPFLPNTNVGINAPAVGSSNRVKDDTTVSSQVARATLASTADRIFPQDNILSQYASYTYNISLYVLSPEQYNEIVRTKRFKVPGAQLLMSSGGAPVSSTTGTGAAGGTTGVTGSSPQTQANATAGRNQFFPLDFYIDDVKLTSLQPGKGTRSPHSNTSLNFKIIEPNGITLFDNLYAAVASYVGKKQNYGSQHYCMVIKFYGYDETGKMVQAQSFGDANGNAAVIEKWIPFRFTGIKFRIANRLTEYECSAICVSNNIATGQARGVIPYNAEINSSTLREILQGPANYRTVFPAIRPTPAAGGTPAAPPPKANSAPQPTITSGLIQALNEYQEKLTQIGPDSVGESVFDTADIYDIVFTDPSIENASVLPPGPRPANQTPTPQPVNANQQVNGAAQTGAAGSKTASATAGTSIIQFLDQTIRNSSYIYDQQLKVVTVDGKEYIRNIDVNQGVKWFRIGVKAEPIRYDFKRRDYAYKITYIVSPYIVNEIRGPNFPSTKFKGTHKKYLYWFTGLNSEILSYEQDFNYLYYIVVNTGKTAQTPIIDFREEAQFAYQTRSNESDQGLAGKTNEAGANAAQQLYSPADLARTKLTILGDPAWIHQGDLWYGATEGADAKRPFFADGSINTELGEPLFEIGFNKPADYNLQSGRMEVDSTYLGSNRYVTGEGGNGLASQSFIYRAISVVSTFAKGRFTQELEGILILFPRSAIKANTAADSQYNETEQETQRLLNNVDRNNAARARQNSANAAATSTTVPAQPSSQQTPVVGQNPPAPAISAPARPPTSSNQPIGPSSAVTNTNAQSGGTTTFTSVSGQVNDAIFQQRNPSAYSQFVAFRSAKEKEIFAEEVARLTTQAANNNNGSVSLRQRELIESTALDIARVESRFEAVQQFAPQIEAAGAGQFTNTSNPAAQQGAVTPRTPQISSREP